MFSEVFARNVRSLCCVSGGDLFYTSMMEAGREVLKNGREGWSKEGRERDG